MELKWLEDFITLADCSSFSRAAEIRNVTQSAFSRRIKQLEVWVGAELISRATVPAEITPAGLNFLPLARETVRNFNIAREQMRPISENTMLRVAALHTLLMTFFPEWLAKLREEGLNLRSTHIPDRGGIEANLAALVDGEADLLLTYGSERVPLILDPADFEFMVLGQDRLLPVAAPEIEIAGRGRISGIGLIENAQVSGFAVPYLGYGLASFFGVALSRIFSENVPFRRSLAHENTISAALKALALQEAGLCWLPESLIRSELARGELVLASADPAWSLDLDIRIYRHRHSRNKMLINLWNWIGLKR